jgi:hypothetical protein
VERLNVSWKREVVLVASVYGAYTLVRNQFGSAHLTDGARAAAYRNAVRVIDIERALRIFHEMAVQQWFIDTSAISFFNIYYGAAHSLVTVGVLIWLLATRPAHFRRWRAVLLFTTVLGLVGYSAFPLMPPRLLDAGGRYGSGSLASAEVAQYSFTDTLREGTAAWSFDSEPVDQISNQYAAMPSLHVAWATWAALVLIKFSRRRWVKGLAILHPVITVLAITATANHFFLDAIGGLAVLGLGYLGAIALGRIQARRRTPAELLAAQPCEVVGG